MGRFTKVGAIVACITALVSSLAVVVFLILGLIGVFPLDSDTPNVYRVQFVANGHVLSDHEYVKGERINTDFIVPSKPDDEKGIDYEFIGWDYTGEGFPDIIPTRAYIGFSANALYRPRSIPSIEPSSSEDSSL